MVKRVKIIIHYQRWKNNNLLINTWQFTAVLWRHLPSLGDREKRNPCKQEDKRAKLENQLKETKKKESDG